MLAKLFRNTNRHAQRRRSLQDTPGSAVTTTRSRRDRRGTVLLIALGALGVISLAGLSYVTFVRLDRLGSTTHARVANFQQQVDATTDWIGTLLAADLYGNKVVSRTVPRDNISSASVGSRVVAWPRRFEDGEYRDHPNTDFTTFPNTNFDLSAPANQRARLLPLPYRPGAATTRFEVAPTDDTFLASIQPIWNQSSAGSLQYRSRWSTISNLRSAFVYVDNWSNPQNPTPADLSDDAYIRQDGRFADLAQFFLDPLTTGGNNRANGGALLSTVVPGRDTGESHDPFELPFAPMNTLDNAPNPAAADFTFQKIDERFLADTDGDLRADARWQELDALGSLFGFRWVVAARVVDLSGLANINVATTANYGANPAAIGAQGDRLPTGRTPADVDLFRLLRSAAGDVPGNNWGLSRYDFTTPTGGVNDQRNIETNALALGVGTSQPTFATHLNEGLGFSEVAIEAGVATPTNITSFSEAPNGTFGWIPQSYRDAYYDRAGADPRNPASSGARAYPPTEMIDLASFWGVNRRALVSRLEERIDGPLNGNGYLPSPDDPNPTVFGPLESALADADGRAFPMNAGDLPSPSAQDLRWGTRNLLTTESGVGLFSPVPVLNIDANNPDGRPLYLGDTGLSRIDLTALSSGRTQDVFQTYLWALAPLAFNEPLTAALIRPNRAANLNLSLGIIDGGVLATSTNGTVDDPALDPAFHYGGGAGGEAERFVRELTGTSVSPLGDNGLGLVPLGEEDIIGASYAVLTSLKLAVNTIDAFDQNSSPTVARYFVTDTGTTAATDPDFNFFFDSGNTGAIELGNRTPVGEIPSNLLDPRILGRFASDLNAQNAYFDDLNGNAGGAGSTLDALNGTGDFNDPMAGAGITVVGLEQQPVISEIYTVAAYSNVGSLDNAERTGMDGEPNLIDPDNVRDQAGAMIVVQLHNPWPDQISGAQLEQFEVWILNPNSTGELIDDPAAPPLKLRTESSGFAQRSLGPGQTAAYVFEYDAGQDQEFVGVDGMLEAFDGQMELGDLRPLELVQPAFNPDVNDSAPPVFFQDWAGTGPGGLGPTVVLMRNVADLEAPALVDIVSGPVGQEFPAVLDNTVQLIDGLPAGATTGTISPGIFSSTDVLTTTAQSLGYDLTPLVQRRLMSAPPVTVRGRLLVTSSISRPIETPTGSGLSAGLVNLGSAFNSVVANDPATNADEEDIIAQVWVEEIDTPDVILMPGQIIQPARSNMNTVFKAALDDTTTLLEATNFADDAFAIAIPAWEVLIPNQAPFSDADLALVSKHAHLCLNHRLNRMDSWITAGEQFAAEARASGLRSTTMGVLDLASSIPGFNAHAPGNIAQDSNEGTIPDESLALPLALRIFDAFEALSPSASSARYSGRINVNTAPQRVLEALPWLAPWADYTTPNLMMSANGLRSRAIMAYRDGFDPQNSGADIEGILDSTGTGVVTPDGITNLSAASRPSDPATTLVNLRRPDLWGLVNNDNTGEEVFIGRGFVSTAELTLLDNWRAVDATPDTIVRPDEAPSGGFFTGPTGFPGFATEHAYDTTTTSLVSGPFALDDRDGYDVPANGQAQRIALYRALANIVETRSDVFGAWFIVRAYDPNVIESIRVDTSDPLAAMEDERFTPAYESRWFVVYDRSSIDDPSDTPEILLQVQLPNSNP